MVAWHPTISKYSTCIPLFFKYCMRSVDHSCISYTNVFEFRQQQSLENQNGANIEPEMLQHKSRDCISDVRSEKKSHALLRRK